METNSVPMIEFDTKGFDVLRRSKYPFVVPKELYSLLASVKEIETTSTLDEILDGLKLYTMEKKLYDPYNPIQIMCKEDELSSVFGVSEFTLFDVKPILWKLLVPQVCSIKCLKEDFKECCHDVPGECSRKRTLGDILKEVESNFLRGGCSSSSNDKNLEGSPMYLHIPLSPDHCDMSDAAESIQGYETAFVKDTSDDSFIWSDANGEDSLSSTIFAVEEVFDVEYEVEYSSENNEDISLSETESDENDLNAALVTVLFNSESDSEFWADESSENDNSDTEISPSDQWQCKKCGSLNKPPMRYCLKCFDQRIHWLPEKKEDFEKWRVSQRRRKPRTRSKKKGVKNLGHASSSKNRLHSSSLSEEEPHSSSTFQCNSFPGSSQDASSSSSQKNSFNSASPSECVSSFSALYEPSSIIGLPGIASTSSSMHSISPFEAAGPSTSTQKESCLPGSLLQPSSSFRNSEDMPRSFSLNNIPSTFTSSQESLFSLPHDFVSASQDASTTSFQDAHIASRLLQKATNDIDSSHGKTTRRDTLEEEKLCIICCSRGAKASIIHGKFGHQVTCYKCARKLQRKKKPCPICRRTIDKVVHQMPIL